MAPRSAANAIVLPSGEKLGDSGSSTDFIATRSSMFRVRTFCTMSVRSFSVRTKYAMRSPFGDHAIHGMTLVRSPRCTRWSKPMSLSKPLVRFRTSDPSFADRSTMSSSRSLRFTVTAAIKSPDGEGAIENASAKLVFSLFGDRSRP